MLIQEFAQKFCQDIIKLSKKNGELFDFDLPFDDVVMEEDGTRVRVINTLNYQIPILDIISSMDREEFAKHWPQAECLEAYENYLSNLIIVEGKDVFEKAQRECRSAFAKIYDFRRNEVQV